METIFQTSMYSYLHTARINILNVTRSSLIKIYKIVCNRFMQQRQAIWTRMTNGISSSKLAQIHIFRQKISFEKLSRAGDISLTSLTVTLSHTHTISLLDIIFMFGEPHCSHHWKVSLPHCTTHCTAIRN